MKTSVEMTNREIEKEKRAQEDLDKARAFKNVFGSADGKIVLKELMRSCHVLSNNRTVHEQSVLYVEGRRSVFMDILGIMRKDEEEILEILLKDNIKDIDEDDYHENEYETDFDLEDDL